MPIVQSIPARFTNLREFLYAPHFLDMNGLRVHYVDEGRGEIILCLHGDPVTRGGDRFFRRLIPTAREQPKITIAGAGHFLQEDKGEEIAGHILDFMNRTPLKN